MLHIIDTSMSVAEQGLSFSVEEKIQNVEAGEALCKGVVDTLEKLKLKKEDFKKKGPKGVIRAHAKVVDALRDAWDETDGFGTGASFEYERVTHGIDFVGRGPHDRIAVAVEVDRLRRPTRSWIKLSDIRAKVKVWVYITPESIDRAEWEFKEAIKAFRRLLKHRRESMEDYGKLLAILKTPTHFYHEEVKW